MMKKEAEQVKKLEKKLKEMKDNLAQAQKEWDDHHAKASQSRPE
jgi:uncharacterized membrane-anchored protein YhcB (DUF1043 family)